MRQSIRHLIKVTMSAKMYPPNLTMAVLFNLQLYLLVKLVPSRQTPYKLSPARALTLFRNGQLRDIVKVMNMC